MQIVATEYRPLRRTYPLTAAELSHRRWMVLSAAVAIYGHTAG